MFPIVECLKYSPLVPTLTKVEIVPMECLSQIFSMTQYDKSVDRIFFDILETKSSISKQWFCLLLGFEPDESRVNPESIPMGQLFSMFTTWVKPRFSQPLQSSTNHAYLLSGMASSLCCSKDYQNEVQVLMGRADCLWQFSMGCTTTSISTMDRFYGSSWFKALRLLLAILRYLMPNSWLWSQSGQWTSIMSLLLLILHSPW